MGEKERWYESDNPSRVVRGGSWRLGVWVAAIVAFSLVIGGIVWGVRVLVSGPKGAGDVVIANNDGKNRINAQAWFEDKYAIILSTDKQLDEAKANLDKHPNDDFYQTNYSGLKNRCNQMVTEYNAESRKTIKADWRSKDLPYQIDSDDEKTDCKETKTQ